MKKAIVALLAVACLCILLVGFARGFGKPRLTSGGSVFNGEELLISIEITKQPWPAFWQPKREYRFKGRSGGPESFIVEALYLADDPEPALICETTETQTGTGPVCVSKRGPEDSGLLMAMRGDFDTRHIVNHELERILREELRKLPMRLPAGQPTML